MPQPRRLIPASTGWVGAPSAEPKRSSNRVGGLMALAITLLVVFVVGIGVGGSLVDSAGGLAGLNAGVGAQPSAPAGAPSDIGVFFEALKLVQDKFVDTSKTTDQNLTWGAIRGMVDALGDTGHSVFLTPDEVKAENDSLNGHVSGIGVVVDNRQVPPTIVSVVPGSPAEAAGLKPGDVIVAVDGKSTESMNPSDIVGLIRGDAGTTVTLSIRHKGANEPTDVSIQRADVSVPASSWAMIPGTDTAVLQVLQFSSGAGDAATKDLQSALDAGAKQIVLDLRGNPGGYVNEAVKLASQFVDSGVVYEEKDRDGNIKPIDVPGGGIATQIPLVVLVDHGSASSAEIVAGAIQGNGRAKLVGETTFGTGTVLNTYDLSDGSAIRLGVLEWLTPKGETIFGKGITPDYVVSLPSDGTQMDPSQIAAATGPSAIEASGDTQLAAALQVLAGHPPKATATPAAPQPSPSSEPAASPPPSAAPGSPVPSNAVN
jgi:carboxyl-terminal processing protease